MNEEWTQRLPEEAPEAEETAGGEGRDLEAEATALLEAYPQLRGQRLPEEVMAQCVQGRGLVEAYREHEHSRQQAELTALREENRLLRQQAESFDRGPVRGVGRGAELGQGDPFLRGFDMEW